MQHSEAVAAGVTRGRSMVRAMLLLVATSTLLAAAPSVAAQPTPVDVTVHETIPTLTQGKIVRGHLDACTQVTVKTIRAGSSERGGVTTFNGSKKFDCGGGNTLTLAFSAKTSGCEETDNGSWQVVRGTGRFASARGQGRLVGSYTLGTGPGTFCKFDGIDDHYTGALQY